MRQSTIERHIVTPSAHDDELLSAPRNGNVPAVEKDFVWGAGIECSTIPHLDIDQFEWTQHNRFWKDDFRRAREEVGVTSLRYAFPWHRLEPAPGAYDWALADQRVEEAARLGLRLVVDVMHFGTPRWLGLAVGEPEFPESLERLAEQLVTRYRATVHHWCPCNEPLILALFSGDFGFWPPHSRKWRGYMPVLARIMQATSRAMRAIRRADPAATIILCDHVENFKTRTPELRQEVARRNLRRFLAMDLLLGRVDRHHPLDEWLLNYGMSELDIQWFASHPQAPDVLGIDYYPNSEWQIERSSQGVNQRRSESPVGLYGIAQHYYRRYGLPMMLTETSADGLAVNREVWLDQTVEDCRRLRGEGIPLNGFYWWPLVDQLDWDGALTHHIGKIHDVGLYNLRRQADGTLARHATPLVQRFAELVRQGNQAVGVLAPVAYPVDTSEQESLSTLDPETVEAAAATAAPAAGRASAPSQARLAAACGTLASAATEEVDGLPKNGETAPSAAALDRYSIVVFSHLRWGFVWQRPQQFLSRFARKHRILFVEEPFFDLPEGTEPRLDFHKVMPNVTVLCPHVSPAWRQNGRLPVLLRKLTREGIAAMNEDGRFDKPLLWYYSPMDAAWSLGYFDNCGVVYDCMDELSNFTGAPPSLVENEARLMRAADIVFTGGYELGEKKQRQHSNVHTFGCGVDFAHFSKATDADTAIPPDIDFMKRPILGWFGVVDERVDYALVGEMARLRPEWSFAMVGPVVKVDPNLLPHAPNLFWLGGREYQQLPNYCKAFDVSMMCFALNAATIYINPTKGLEYMAAGRPIVSTPVKDVVRQWSDIVRLARTPAEFVAAAEEALAAGPGDARVARGLELARRCAWESTVDQMQQLIRTALTAPRASKAAVEPLSEAELEFAYLSTPGS